MWIKNVACRRGSSFYYVAVVGILGWFVSGKYLIPIIQIIWKPTKSDTEILLEFIHLFFFSINHKSDADVCAELLSFVFLNGDATDF